MNVRRQEAAGRFDFLLLFVLKMIHFVPMADHLSFPSEKLTHFTQKSGPKLSPNGLQITVQVLK